MRVEKVPSLHSQAISKLVSQRLTGDKGTTTEAGPLCEHRNIRYQRERREERQNSVRIFSKHLIFLRNRNNSMNYFKSEKDEEKG